MQHKAILATILIVILAYSKSQAQAITDTATLRSAINTLITTNGTQQITAAKLNRILNGTLNVMPHGNRYVDTLYQRGDSLFYKKNGIEYFGAVTGGPSFTAAPNSPQQYLNGYKQFAPLNADSIPGGTANMYWHNTNANAGWGLGVLQNSGGTAFTYSADTQQLATLPQARRIADSATAAVLPPQNSNAGKYLTTNGSAVAWGNVGGGGGSTDTTSLSNRISSLAAKQSYYYVTDYGAVGDSVTDNTTAIQNAINDAFAGGGGVVYFPFNNKGQYLVKGPILTSDPYGNAINNAQLYTPFVPYNKVDVAPTITLMSDFPPNPVSDYDTGLVHKEPTRTVQLISTLGGSNVGAILGSTYGTGMWGNWNFTQLFIKNLTFVVRSVTSAGLDTVPTLSALDFTNQNMSNLENVKVKTQSYLARAVAPLQGITGIKGPVNLNFNATNWRNVYVQGFDRGLSLSENATITSTNINGCDTGIVLNQGDHNVAIARAIVQWCKVNLAIAGRSNFDIGILDIENYLGISASGSTPDKWFNNVWDIYEEGNTGSIGNIRHRMTYAWLGYTVQDLKTQIYSPLVSLNQMLFPIGHTPSRNYLQTKPLYATVANDHVIGLDLSKVTFGMPLGGATSPRYSYLRIPSNDGVDSTGLNFNSAPISSMHGTDINSGFGDVRIGASYYNGLGQTGASATFFAPSTGHNGSAYITALNPTANVGIVVPGASGQDTALVVKASGNVSIQGHKLGIGLTAGTEPTADLQTGSTATVRFGSLSGGGIVYSDGLGNLTNTATGAGSASGSNSGIVSLGNQTLGTGTKTMQEVATTSSFDLPITSSSTVGVLNMNGNPVYHSYNSLDNTFNGYAAGNFSLSGTGNAAFGYQSLLRLTAGTWNTSIGSSAGNHLTWPTENTFLGFGAGGNVSDAGSNILIGAFSGKNIYSNANGGGNAGFNVMIGDSAGSVITYNGSYNVLLGHYALNFPSTIPNNKFCVTGGSSGNNLLYGDFNTGQLQVNATQYSPALTTSAAFEVVSTSKGLLPPRMTTSQRNAIGSPVAGLTVYCTDCTATDASAGVMQTYNGSLWKNNW